MTVKVLNIKNLESESFQSMPTISSEINRDDGPEKFLLKIFKFFRLLGLSPFFIVVGLNGSYQIQSSLWQKTYSSFVAILVLAVYVSNIRGCVERLNEKSPIAFFRLFRSLLSLSYKLDLFWLLWTKQTSFLNILNYLKSCPYLSKSRIPKICCRFVIPTVLALYSTVGLIYGVLVSSRGTCLTETKTLYTNYFWRRLNIILIESRYTFFHPNPNECINDLYNLFIYDWFYIILGVFAYASRFLMGLHADLFIFFCVLSLLFPTINFIQDAKATDAESGLLIGNSKHSHIIKHYDSLRKFSQSINSIIGMSVFLYIAEAIFAYPVNFYDLVWTTNPFQTMLLALFYCTTVGLLVASSEICRRMHFLRNWLFENKQHLCLQASDTILLLDDLNQNSVAISASAFQITYYAVGTIGSLVLTFFIIRLQGDLQFEEDVLSSNTLMNF